VNADLVRKNYKKHWINYATWEKKLHYREDMVYPGNISESVTIDELNLSKGELYTCITSKGRQQRNGTIIAFIVGSNSDDIIHSGLLIPESERIKVKEISLDMAATMRLAATTLFPNARLVTDRFHVVKLVLEALQSIRIEYRWESIEQENKEIANCRKEVYNPPRFSNGETRKELIARSSFLLFHMPYQLTDYQKERANILFKEYPKHRNSYRLAVKLRKIYDQKSPQRAKARIRKWFNEIKIWKIEQFNTVANSIRMHLDTILNFFINQSTNAFAESFNAKIKLFRANLRGVSNPDFFLFRLEKLFA
jgi:transposase